MALQMFHFAALAAATLPSLASATPHISLRQVNSTSGRGCDALARAGLSDQLYFQNDTEYQGTLNTYYDGSIQALTPRCVLKPESTQHVSDALKVLSEKGGSCWTVGIRSGGHSVAPNNNAQNGVTIDLGRLSSVTYTADAGSEKGQGIASIGSGARWGDVYTELEKDGVMVTGAREDHVGVGGFLLGGGFSWQSGRHGMACDNVVGYEVVLANGTVVTATSTSHPDLWQSLKGGLNNIGLVTRFDMQTFPSQDAYGGIVAFPYTSAEGLLETFTSMVKRNSKQPEENGFVSLTYSPATGPSAAFVLANVDGAESPTSFTGLGELTPMIDMRSRTPISGLVKQLEGALGLYNVWFTLTFHANMDIGRKILEVFDSLIADVKDVLGASDQIIFVLTPLPRNYANHGPNVLDLNNSLDEDCMVLQAEALLSIPEHKALLTEKLQEAVEQTLNSYATETQSLMKWKYLNYANTLQDVWWTIGDSQDLLKRTSRAYDPAGFFQTSVTGGFKFSDVDE
ncbi:FAD binding domain-containing protein [Colletotrichum plurivorum]|uniref:FAD binding domain-containing protein n=1 Tax=Colletotrichum plurivorum TaxID=2175906 RepID=A0A8H6N7L6_9PEZI|nr:FAD binding domain-containing protein [Colletotrichum plurivorum]